jgi:hypothetical protein
MLIGFVWRFWCDQTRTTSSTMDLKYLSTHLKLGEPAITSSTYLGAILPAHFCTNFKYPFKVANGWQLAY